MRRFRPTSNHLQRKEPMEQEEKSTSEQYFRTPPYGYNCAQSIFKGFQQEYGITQEVIDSYAPMKGGLAPGGMCGALYAATQLMKQAGKDSGEIAQLQERFAARAGHTTCREIKTLSRYPCHLCVRLAHQLLKEETDKEKTNKTDKQNE